jgi:hypothetical protein
MTDLTYLFLALALMWTGALGYLIRLVSLRKQLEERMYSLQERIESREPSDG